jgi:hypothetical protein
MLGEAASLRRLMIPPSSPTWLSARLMTIAAERGELIAEAGEHRIACADLDAHELQSNRTSKPSATLEVAHQARRTGDCHPAGAD